MEELPLGIGHDEGGAPLQARRRGTVINWWNEYAFLVDRAIDRETLIQALALAERWGTSPHTVLVSQGWVTPEGYVEALAHHLGVSAFSADAPPSAGAALIEPTRIAPARIASDVDRLRRRGLDVVLVSPAQLDQIETMEEKARRSRRAIAGLLEWSPALSAGAPIWSWQLFAVTIAAGLFVGGVTMAPDVAGRLAFAALTLAFLPVVVLRVAILGLSLRHRQPQKATARIPDADLPEYSVLVPLFHEVEVLPDLVRDLSALDYPPAKLDVLLVLESVDTEMRRAIDRLELPGFMRVVVVPDTRPRTKPKALNYALQFARGSYVVVYDAEDLPESDQLRRAVAAFDARDKDTFCLQAKLNIHNARDGWLARQFALEYSVLFDMTLPALVRLGVPVPLGGTSNHFPREVLERWTGWDPFNVTEDADLGVRLARHGGRVAMLDSTTWEEAPVSFGVWLRQRTRWNKGWMQTYLVHTRRPIRLLRELGPIGFLGFHLYSGGLLLSALVFPLFCATAAHELSTGSLFAEAVSVPERALIAVSAFNLAGALVAALLSGVLSAWRRGRPWLLRDVPTMPVYWLLISLAAYRALIQLVVAPYLWEKTQHQARTRSPQAAG
jgi:cellulose synthase/poly-beta-1,6-N-acetylglucosamine synthase-like glycosyltransferase